MTENNQDMVDKPNPSSEKKLKLPKKSHSDYNATPANKEELLSSDEPRVSYWWTWKKSKREDKVKETLFINDASKIFKHFINLKNMNEKTASRQT